MRGIAAAFDARAQEIAVNSLTGRKMDELTNPMTDWLPKFRIRARRWNFAGHHLSCVQGCASSGLM